MKLKSSYCLWKKLTLSIAISYDNINPTKNKWKHPVSMSNLALFENIKAVVKQHDYNKFSLCLYYFQNNSFAISTSVCGLDILQAFHKKSRYFQFWESNKAGNTLLLSANINSNKIDISFFYAYKIFFMWHFCLPRLERCQINY